MSFETLANTMTLHGALRLLNLPTAAGQKLTLAQIRDAYREMALANHPDSGGCDQTMRRLNEAYQLLKELYRTS
jgi:curved DNA-binding protein CbpA